MWGRGFGPSDHSLLQALERSLVVAQAHSSPAVAAGRLSWGGPSALGARCSATSFPSRLAGLQSQGHDGTCRWPALQNRARPPLVAGGASAALPTSCSRSRPSCLHLPLPLLQDVLLVEHQRPWPGSDACGSTCGDASAGSARCSSCGANVEEYSLFAVFDGHNGASAARLAAKELVGVLEERLPQGAPPAPTSPTYQPWREDIQLALIETLAELNKRFALRGILAGCTATLVLQVGLWLAVV